MEKQPDWKVAEDVAKSIIEQIELFSDDIWPDHLWPYVKEICDEICLRIEAGVAPMGFAIDAIEKRMDGEGVSVRDVYEGDRPVHKAYCSLIEVYTELLFQVSDLEAEIRDLKKRLDSRSKLGGN